MPSITQTGQPNTQKTSMLTRYLVITGNPVITKHVAPVKTEEQKPKGFLQTLFSKIFKRRKTSSNIKTAPLSQIKAYTTKEVQQSSESWTIKAHYNEPTLKERPAGNILNTLSFLEAAPMMSAAQLATYESHQIEFASLNQMDFSYFRADLQEMLTKNLKTYQKIMDACALNPTEKNFEQMGKFLPLLHKQINHTHKIKYREISKNIFEKNNLSEKQQTAFKGIKSNYGHMITLCEQHPTPENFKKRDDMLNILQKNVVKMQKM